MVAYTIVFFISSIIMILSFYTKNRYLNLISLVGGASSNLFLTKTVGDIGNHIGNITTSQITKNTYYSSKLYYLFELFDFPPFEQLKIFLFLTTLLIPVIFFINNTYNPLFFLYYFYVFIPYYTNYLTHGFATIIFIVFTNSIILYLAPLLHHGILFNIVLKLFYKYKFTKVVLIFIPLNLLLAVLIAPKLSYTIQVYSTDIFERFSLNSLLSFLFYFTFTVYLLKCNRFVFKGFIVKPGKLKLLYIFSVLSIFELIARIYISSLLYIVLYSCKSKKNTLFEFFIVIMFKLKLLLHLYRSYFF
jgi:hypothetical protein